METILAITGTCEGGGHTFVDVTRDGKTRRVVFETSEILSQKDEFLVDSEEKAILKQIRQIAQKEGLKRIADVKTAFTDRSVTL